MVFELGLVLGLVVGGVEIVAPGLEAGIHQHKVLIGQGQVHQKLSPGVLDHLDGVGDLVGVKLGSFDVDAGAFLDRFGDGIAFRLGAAGQRDLGEDVGIHRHLVHGGVADATRANNQCLAHGKFSFRRGYS